MLYISVTYFPIDTSLVGTLVHLKAESPTPHCGAELGLCGTSLAPGKVHLQHGGMDLQCREELPELVWVSAECCCITKEGLCMSPPTWASRPLFWSPASCVAFCQPTKRGQMSPGQPVPSLQNTSLGLSGLLTPPGLKHCISLRSPTVTSAKSLLSRPPKLSLAQ